MINGQIDVHLYLHVYQKNKSSKKTEIRQNLIHERNKLLVTTDGQPSIKELMQEENEEPDLFCSLGGEGGGEIELE